MSMTSSTTEAHASVESSYASHHVAESKQSRDTQGIIITLLDLSDELLLEIGKRLDASSAARASITSY